MKIVVTSPSFAKNEILRKELLQYFPDTRLNFEGVHLKDAALIQFIKDADGLIVGLEKIDKFIIDQLPTIKIISKYGVGLDNIDVDYCRSKNIRIGWTPGVNKLSVAEMTIAFMLMLLRNLYITSNQLKNGVWNKNGGYNLTGKTIGIIGVGNIGKEVIRLLKPYYCKILVNDLIDQQAYYKDNDLMETSKDEIFKRSDIITIHTPLNDTTRHLVSENSIMKMKISSCIVNTARGGIVNMNDLKRALENKIIAGAAIDVYENEPPDDQDLAHIPNLICTPHIGGNSYESVVAMGRSAISHLKNFFR
jgi:phosphoglycerate dehydrogenase-like enzyme